MKVKGDTILDLYIDIDYAFKRETTPGWGYNNKNLQFNNLVYVYGGRGHFGCNGEVKTVSAGDLVFMPRGCDRWMKTDSNSLLRLYTVNFKAALPNVNNDGGWEISTAELPFEFVRRIEDEAARKRFEVLFERLCLLYMAGKRVQKIKQRAALAEVLELAELCRINCDIGYSGRNTVNDSVKYMAENYKNKLTLSILAENAELSVSHYSAIFRAVTGRSPIDYLIQLRIFKAKQLLNDGFSVTRTAEESGFADIYYFSNMFKKSEGISPTEYIKRNK